MNENMTAMGAAVGAEGNESNPDVQGLLTEYELAWTQEPDAPSRIARAEDVRYTRWPGQSWDGLKHQELLPEGERAMPYDRAPDCRVPLADQAILSLVDTDYASFWNARVKTAPAAASRMSAAGAAELRQMISWMIHGPLRSRLIDDVEFASQVLRTIGWVVLHPVWREEKQLRLRKITMDQVLGLARQADSGGRGGAPSVLGELPELILDPTMEEAAVEMVRLFFPELKAGRARRVVRELREEGEAEFPVADRVKSVPELQVLVPWQDIILPSESTADPERGRCIFWRKFFNESELRQRAAEEEWNEEFLANVLKTKGEAREDGTSIEHAVDENFQLFELVYAHARQVNEEGVPGIWCTVVCPHVPAKVVDGKDDPGTYGGHWLVDDAHGQYPFVFLTTEVTGRRPQDARGVPDVLATSQMEMKCQRDATYVYAQLSVTPPLQKKGTQASKLPPELGPLGIINNAAGGEWSWFPPPPGHPEIAFKLIEDVRREGEQYYGVPRADNPPMLWQTRQQRQVMRWLAKWGEALWQLSVLAYQHLPADELGEILGRAPLLDAETVARHRLLLWFDVRSLDPAWVEGLLKSISELVLPADVSGVVDRAKLVQFALAYLDPTLAEEVTSDETGAKQSLFKGVREEIGSMMQGNEGLYVENDPTAKAKLAFGKQVLAGNPEYQLQLDERSPQFNPRKRELVEKWFKNLGQSVAQQENKTIGRLGVRPGS